jgi:probable F420-dependent oxidoreductase
MDLGIGRGDSARRVLGKPPTSMKDLELAVHVIRALAEGRSIEYEGAVLELPWAGGHRLPVWIAGYGPVALKLTGRIADGAMLQIGDPDLVRWFVSQVRDSAREAGRDPDAVTVMAAAPAHVGDLADARDRTRWFPALVSNHVVDLVNKYPRDDLPAELTQYIHDREGYDYLHHAEVGSTNAAFVTDDIVDRFCLVGSVDQHLERLHALADAGVDQFNLYLMNGDEEQQLEVWGREIIPAMRGRASASA